MATGILFCLFLVFITPGESPMPPCEEVITMGYAGTCFHLNFTYSNPGATWPNYPDYYKSSECESFSGCSYCYIGETGGTKTFSVNVTSCITPRQISTFTFQLADVVKNTSAMKIPRDDLLPTFQPLNYFRHTDFAPVPWSGFLQTYYDRINSTFYPKKCKTVPLNGKFQLYARDPGVLYQYNFTWFTPLSCNVLEKVSKDHDEPLLSMDCNNNLQWPIVYSVSPPYFEMRNDSLYLKSSAISGDFNVAITAMFKGINKSATTEMVSLEVGQIFITNLTAVKERKDLYIFTCYTNNTYNDLTYEWFWNKVKITKGSSTSMQNGISVGKLVFDGLSGKETGNVICHATRKMNIPATMTKHIRTNDFPVVELIATSHIIKNGIPVQVTCYLHPKDVNTTLVLIVNNQQINVSRENTDESLHTSGSGSGRQPEEKSVPSGSQFDENTDESLHTCGSGSGRQPEEKSVPSGSQFDGVYFRNLDDVSPFMLFPSKDLNFSCYGVNDVGRGEIKTLQISMEIVITRLTAAKERKDLYIFTCYTNNTYNDLTYEWFWNTVKITKGLSTSIKNGKSQGKLAFDGLSGKETGLLTCRATRKRFNISAAMIKHINTEGFPMVELNSTSQIIKYEIPAEAACYLLPKYVNSTLILMVNDQVINESKVNLTQDSNITCYGVSPDGQGEIKTLRIIEEPVFITDLTTIKDRTNRYIFTCYTNSSFTDLIYEWHWNQFKVYIGLSTSMTNGKSQGKFTFDGLRENESGKLTCSVKRKGSTMSATRIISTEDLPIVQLNTTSHLITNKISVAEVACYLLPKYVNSTVVLKVNNQPQDKSKVELSEEANVSCYGVNGVGRGEIKTLQIFEAIGTQTCPTVTSNNIIWLETIAGTTAYVPCTKEYLGVISRLCSLDGRWQDQDKSNCVKRSIMEIRYKLSRIATIGGGFGTAMEQLAYVTKGDLEAEDITETLNVLDIVFNISDSTKTWNETENQNFVDVVSNLLGKDKQAGWEILEKKKNLTAAYVLKKMDEFGRHASQRINGTIFIQVENLVFESRKVDANNNIEFPVLNEYQPGCCNNSHIGIVVPANILKTSFGANESIFMNTVLYKTMTDLLPKPRNQKYSKNSLVFSMSLGETLVNLTENISITFPHLSEVFKEPSCNFWDFEENGYWSSEGCVVQSTNSTHTVCSCDHLTDFILLMKRGPHKENKVMGTFTIVGCSISSFALLLTMLLYRIYWKYVTSYEVTRSQSTLLMNLCVSLIVGYLLFLTLVEETKNEIVCKAIAALTQYFFLVSFFSMLAEGLDMAISLTVVFASKVTRLPWLLALSWVGPAIIVSITLGVTKTEGFGNEKTCWLSWKNNVNLAFIIPVLVIIVVNIICVLAIMKALFSTHSMLHKSNKQRLRAGARAIGVLTPLLGFTWAFGIFASNDQMVAFEYLFTVANSFQGLFIFITYCVFNDQIRDRLWRRKGPNPALTPEPLTNNYNEMVSTRRSRILNNLRRLPSIAGNLWRNPLPNVSNEVTSTDDNFRESSEDISPGREYESSFNGQPSPRKLQ